RHGLHSLWGANKDGNPGREILPQRHVEKRPGRFHEASVFRRSDDTGYPHRPVFYLQKFANGILTAPELRGHGFIHYGDERRGFVIGTGKLAPGDKRNPQGGKVGGADLVVLDGRLLVGPSLITSHADGGGRVHRVAERRDTPVGC